MNPQQLPQHPNHLPKPSSQNPPALVDQTPLELHRKREEQIGRPCSLPSAQGRFASLAEPLASSTQTTDPAPIAEPCLKNHVSVMSSQPIDKQAIVTGPNTDMLMDTSTDPKPDVFMSIPNLAKKEQKTALTDSTSHVPNINHAPSKLNVMVAPSTDPKDSDMPASTSPKQEEEVPTSIVAKKDVAMKTSITSKLEGKPPVRLVPKPDADMATVAAPDQEERPAVSVRNPVEEMISSVMSAVMDRPAPEQSTLPTLQRAATGEDNSISGSSCSSSDSSLSSPDQTTLTNESPANHNNSPPDDTLAQQHAILLGLVETTPADSILTPLRTKNEKDATSVPIVRPDVALKPQHVLRPVGKISGVVENGTAVVVLSCAAAAHTAGEKAAPIHIADRETNNATALDVGTALWLGNRSLLGAVAETFGPVAAPVYLVRFETEAELAATGAAPRKEVFFVAEYSTTVRAGDVRVKGYDSSNMYDEECGTADFSDDEKEAAYKRRMKAAQRRPTDDGAPPYCPPAKRGRGAGRGMRRGRGLGRVRPDWPERQYLPAGPGYYGNDGSGMGYPAMGSGAGFGRGMNGPSEGTSSAGRNCVNGLATAGRGSERQDGYGRDIHGMPSGQQGPYGGVVPVGYLPQGGYPGVAPVYGGVAHLYGGFGQYGAGGPPGMVPPPGPGHALPNGMPTPLPGTYGMPGAPYSYPSQGPPGGYATCTDNAFPSGGEPPAGYSPVPPAGAYSYVAPSSGSPGGSVGGSANGSHQGGIYPPPSASMFMPTSQPQHFGHPYAHPYGQPPHGGSSDRH